jgi:nicotinamidase-related amidase
VPSAALNSTTSVVVVIDLQPSFLNGIVEADRVLDRSHFLIEAANLLDVPVLATQQYPSRMGGLESGLASRIDPQNVFGKMTFSCVGCPPFFEKLSGMKRHQVVIVGIETHICVSETAHHLVELNYQVVVCPDAVSARTLDRHKIGMERIRDSGAVPAHSEAIAYEWMKTAENEKFRDMLKLVKAAKF